MSKLVYLFELDSVRKTDEEIIVGQRTLYNEIVRNGNIVVLTYNQLIDSRGFFSLFNNSNYYQSIIKLFENGALCISQYDKIKSISQYFISSIENDNPFLYSAIPLTNAQKYLIALVKKSLMYSDLSEIHNYIAYRNDDVIKELFIEMNDGVATECQLTIDSMKKTLENLYWFISMILRLSPNHNIYLSPRSIEEYERLKMNNILDIVLNFEYKDNPLWIPAVKIIKDLISYKSKLQSRSPYIREIKRKSLDNTDLNITAYQYAQVIINLCYNYACEISICNTSKHYNISELILNKDEKITFTQDFFSRLAQDWDNGINANVKYLTEEKNNFIKFEKFNAIPDFSRAARVTEYVDYIRPSNRDNISRYENNLDFQRKNQIKQLHKKMCINSLSLLLYMVTAIFLDLSIQLFQNFSEGDLSFLYSMISTLNFLGKSIWFFITSEIISNLVSKKFPNILSLSESIKAFKTIIEDAIKIRFKSGDSYVNNCNNNLDPNKKDKNE